MFSMGSSLLGRRAPGGKLREDLSLAHLAARMSMAAARAPSRSTSRGTMNSRGPVVPAGGPGHSNSGLRPHSTVAVRGSTWSTASNMNAGRRTAIGQSIGGHADQFGGDHIGPTLSLERGTLHSQATGALSEDARDAEQRGVSFARGIRHSRDSEDAEVSTYEDMLHQRLTETQEKLQMRLTQARSGSRSGEVMEEEMPLRRMAWTAFVDGEGFKAVIAALLLLNMWALALETDYPGWPWWDPINGLFLLVFIVEFGFRLLHRGPKNLLWTGKMRRWMAYDLLVIGIGVLDVVISCLYVSPLRVADAALASMQEEFGSEDPDTGSDLEVRVLAAARLVPASTGRFDVVRFLMLLRLLRIGRVLRIIGPLYDCVNLLMDMMSTFIWILTIIFLMCFVLAIILTRLLGHGLAVKTEDEELRMKVHTMFSDIPTALFTLFQLTTAEDWSYIAGPVVQTSGIWRCFFVVFITSMSWTMLSLLTAVASETMIAFSSYKKEEEKIYQEIQRHNFTTFLCSEFLRADSDGNHMLNKDEFTTLMSRPSMMEEMKSHGIHLADQDLVRTWDTFDIDDSGELSIDELVTGFAYLQESLAMKHVANVGYALKRFSVRMDTDFEDMEHMVDTFTQIKPMADRVIERSARTRERWASFMGTDGTKGDGRQDANGAWNTSFRQNGSQIARKTAGAASSSPGGADRRIMVSSIAPWNWARSGSQNGNHAIRTTEA